MHAAHVVRRLWIPVLTGALVLGVLPAGATAAPVVGAAAAQATGAVPTRPAAGAGTPLGVPVGAPVGARASSAPDPTVRTVAVSGIDADLLGRAPAPHEHGEGQVAAMSAPHLRPALATTVRLSRKKAGSLLAVVADEPFESGSSIQVRVKDRAGWSRWMELPVDPEHGPDPGSDEARAARVGSDPLLTLGARRVRLRIDTPSGRLPAGTGLVVVKAPTASSDARLGSGTVSQLGAVGQMASVGQPPITTRAQWGANESWRSRAPYYTDNVRAGFVHHTASTSSYDPDEAAAQVRAIYAYHTKKLGHSDIDYNFLVDRFGRLYEGRYGGMDRPVLGGHTAGFNEHTFAVSALGNFDTYSPPARDMAAIKDSIARLFAWKLGLHGVSPSATVELVSAGFVRAIRYPKGTVARISATSSHQTVNYTACPGRYLQRQLADIRALGGSYSAVVLSAPSPAGRTVTAGSTTPVSFSSHATRAVTWRAEVRSPCSDTPVRTYTGSTSGAGSVSFAWDLRDAAGTPVLPATYTIALSGTTSGGTPVPVVTGDVTVAPVPGGAWGPCANASRVVGTGPSGTSVLWGRIHAAGTSVVVLTGAGGDLTSRAAGLVAAPLARSLSAPLLLTAQGALSEEVAADISARRATQVLIVGGTDVVSDSVASRVAALGATVTRLAGAGPAGTARAVAGRFPPTARAVLASPDGAPGHAIAGAALAAERGVPLLLASGGSIPAETRAALAGRPSVTVTAPMSLSDATIRSALGAIPWDRLAGSSDIAGALAVAAAFAGPVTSVLLPDTAVGSPVAGVAAALGVPILLTSGPVLSGEIAQYLRARPAMRGTQSPVSSDLLADEVLGAASRVLLGQPWSPGTVVEPSVAATAKRTVKRANAYPEPTRRGRTLYVRATVRAKYTDGKWRKVPAGVPFTVQFKARKTKKYRTVASGTTTTGMAKASVTVSKSGRWRIVIGGKRSASDYVGVKR